MKYEFLKQFKPVKTVTQVKDTERDTKLKRKTIRIMLLHLRANHKEMLRHAFSTLKHAKPLKPSMAKRTHIDLTSDVDTKFEQPKKELAPSIKVENSIKSPSNKSTYQTSDVTKSPSITVVRKS